jgi:cell division protein FtsQ
MARNDGYTPPDDETSSPPRSRGTNAPARSATRPAAEDSDLDPRLLDLDDPQETPFLRAQKRVPVRRSALPRKTADRLKLATIALICLAVVVVAGYQFYRYGATSWRFRIDSSDDIQIAGIQNVTRTQVMEVFAVDIGRNVFFVPLSDREKQLEQIPWVESATVMRLMPHQLRIQVKERTPVAFAQVGSRVQLIDASGVLMDLPRGANKYSFPVLIGMSEAEPLSTRSARMKIYSRVVADLDANAAHNSAEVSEMDLRDPGDVKITVADDTGAVLVHLGDSNYLDRFNIFKSHIQEWRQKFSKVESVDLRYDRQVIVNPDTAASAPLKTAPVEPSKAKPAAAKQAKKPAAAAAPRKTIMKSQD